MAVGGGADIYAGAARNRIAAVDLSGCELNAPKSYCVVGVWLGRGRGSGVHAGKSLPLLRKRH